MKQYLVIFIILISGVLSAQEVPISKSVISSYNWKNVTGVSVEFNPTFISREIAGSDLRSFLEMTVGVQYSRESSTSVLGFTTGMNISFESLVVENDEGHIDSLNTFRVKIPAYLKLRMGDVNARSQKWLALGAGYSFKNNIGVSTVDADNNQIAKQTYPSLIKGVPYLTSIWGYERLGASNFIRGTLYYIRMEYYLKDRFNKDLNYNRNHVLYDKLDTVFFERLNIHFGFALLF